MKKLIVFLFGVTLAINAQLKLTIDSDKNNYEYGESIKIICTLANDADTSVTFFAFNNSTCQAEFILNEFYSENWEACLPLVEEINFPPHSERIYSWTIDPYVLGLPDKDGEQSLIGYFNQGWNTFDTEHLKDTTTFNAPKFLGGQLFVNFSSTNQGSIDSLKTLYNAEVLESSEFSGNVDEIWQLLDIQIDTAKVEFENSGFFNLVEYNRFGLAYDSILVTSVERENKLPTELTLLQNYPNPFNPTTTLKFSIPKVETQHAVSLQTKFIVYDVLGREIETLINKEMLPGSYEVIFDARDLPSGVYFYQLTAGNYSATKKMLLMK